MIHLNITSSETELDAPAEKVLHRPAFYAPALARAGKWLAKMGVRLHTRHSQSTTLACACDCDHHSASSRAC